LCSPYKFESPWSAWEFAYHVLHKQANLVILSMAWLTREDARSYSRTPKEPDMETLSYWLARLEPVIRDEDEGEVIVVLANRCGSEGEAVYAGTSTVLGIQGGEVKVYGILGRGEKELLVIDTTNPPQAKLIAEPRSSTTRSNRDSISSNPRTNSTMSDNSAKSAPSGLSLATGVTAGSSFGPTTPDAMGVLIDETITPISPIDATSPTHFFAPYGRRTEGDHRRESLKSSIYQPPEPNPAKSDSPTFVRPSSPKSRNCSRTRKPEYQEPDGSPNFFRPPSPKSRNCSRTRKPERQEPALIAHDLAKEPQITSRIKPPPHSASTMPDQYDETFPEARQGSRSRHTSPRPKSAAW
jgi:protein N-terminal amidase